jgi:hypothetical protein
LKIGVLSRLAQFFISVSKNNNLEVEFPWLTIGNSEKFSVAVETIINDPICLTVILMSEEVFDGNRIGFKRAINNKLVSIFDMPFTIYKRQMQMMAVDHSIEKYAKPECFYISKDGSLTVRDGIYFSHALKAYVSEIAKHAKFSSIEFSSLGELIAELIANTDEHSRVDYLHGISDRSVRALIFRVHQIGKGKDISEVCGQENPFFDYISRIKDKDGVLDLLEISIFDSGPGLYKSFSTDESDFDNEVLISKKCFLDGVTSKPNGIGVGRGLSKARFILNDRQGFLSIRTGRISVFRDYHLHPLNVAKDGKSTDITFFDEVNRRVDSFTEMVPVAGVSYTILVPLK